MGNLSVILILGAILTGGLVVAQMQSTTGAADATLSEYQHQMLAREAATAGLNVAVQKVTRSALDNDGDWGMYLPVTDVPYERGTYTVTGDAASFNCSGLSSAANLYWTNLLGLTSGHLIEIVSTGEYQTAGLSGDDLQRHQIRACYAYSVSTTGTPPAFHYAFVSNETFDFNGGPDIISVDVDGEGNIHSNAEMELGPQVTIDGNASYVDDTNSDINKKAEITSHGTGDTIDLKAFDPEVYRENNSYSTGSYDVSGTEMHGSAETHTEDNPFIWFIDGDLTVGNNSHLILPGHSIIITTGTLTINGNANVTVSEDAPPTQEANESDEDYKARMRQWIDGNLTDDGKSKTAFYANGDAEVGGTGTVVGNFYTNGDFTLNGGGQGSNLVGGVIALGEITANGGGNGNNFWYTGLSEGNIIPGVIIPTNWVTLIAISEWTDPVLDAAGI